VGYGGGFVTLYATQTGKELRSATIPGRPIVEDVQFLGGTGQLAVASSKGLYLWSLAGTPGCCRRVSPLWTDSVSADPRDPLKVVVINTKGTMTWNLAGTLRSILISPYSVHDAAFSPDSREVVTASQDGMVRVWYAQPRELGADFTDSYAGGSTEPLDGAAYMGTSDRIAALGYAGKVHVFSPDGGTPTSVGAAVDDMAWDLAGTEMATATSDGVVNLWHATGSGYVEATLPSPIDVSDMLNLSLSWDGVPPRHPDQRLHDPGAEHTDRPAATDHNEQELEATRDASKSGTTTWPTRRSQPWSRRPSSASPARSRRPSSASTSATSAAEPVAWQARVAVGGRASALTEPWFFRAGPARRPGRCSPGVARSPAPTPPPATWRGASSCASARCRRRR